MKTDINSLLKEADESGILNIDIDGDHLSPEVIKIAIDATKNLNSRLNKEEILTKLDEVDRIAAAR
jgi:hypothetical protein